VPVRGTLDGSVRHIARETPTHEASKLLHRLLADGFALRESCRTSDTLPMDATLAACRPTHIGREIACDDLLVTIGSAATRRRRGHCSWVKRQQEAGMWIDSAFRRGKPCEKRHQKWQSTAVRMREWLNGSIDTVEQVWSRSRLAISAGC